MTSSALSATGTQSTGSVPPAVKKTGGTFAALAVCRLDTSGRLVAAQSNSLANCPKGELFVALAESNAADQFVPYAKAGDIVTVSGLTAGETYVVSATTAGQVAPIADLASTNILAYVGFALTATTLQLLNYSTGVAKP